MSDSTRENYEGAEYWYGLAQELKAREGELLTEIETLRKLIDPTKLFWYDRATMGETDASTPPTWPESQEHKESEEL